MEPRSQSSSQPPLPPSTGPSTQTPTHFPPGTSSSPISQPPTQPLSESRLQPTSQASLQLSAHTSSHPSSQPLQIQKQPPRGTSLWPALLFQCRVSHSMYQISDGLAGDDDSFNTISQECKLSNKHLKQSHKTNSALKPKPAQTAQPTH